MDTIVVTPEERAASNKYKDIRRGYCKEAMTDEEKELYRSYWRKAYIHRKAAMTEKEYEAFLDKSKSKSRRWRKGLSPEREEEYKRKRRENANDWYSIPENRERQRLRKKLVKHQGTDVPTRRKLALQAREEWHNKIKDIAIDKYEAEKAAFFAKLERGE